MNEMFRRLFNLPVQASSVATEIDVLHYVVLSITILGATGVALAIAILSLRYREREGRGHGIPRAVPLWLEFLVISGLLSLFLAFWVVGFRQYMRLKTPPDNTMDVYVVGKQWMWAFAYPDGGASNADLYVPVGKPVKLLITSRDVIHSFYVPAFRIKQDAVPGRMTVAWFQVEKAGAYEILCAEYCGHSHSLMRGRVIALSPERYESWQRQRWHDEGRPLSVGEPLLGAEAPVAPANLARAGERVASERGCLRCHTLDGTPHLGPTWAGLYQSEIPLEEGRNVRADDAYLTESMMDPQVHVHQGFAAIMPSYWGLLSAGETASIVELIHSLRGRTQGDREDPLPVPTQRPIQLPEGQNPGPGFVRGVRGTRSGGRTP